MVPNRAKPLTCTAGDFQLVRVPALTLIDTLDTLIVLNNFTEFARAVERLRYLDAAARREHGDETPGGGGLFALNQNVSLFESTIRLLGGLLSAHQLAEAFAAGRVPRSEVLAAEDAPDDVAPPPDAAESVGPAVDPAADDAPANLDEADAEEGRECRQNGKEKNATASAAVPMWEYDGLLLELAHDIGKRLMPAFDTDTGVRAHCLP